MPARGPPPGDRSPPDPGVRAVLEAGLGHDGHIRLELFVRLDARGIVREVYRAER